MYEGSQWNEQTVAVTINLEDAYNRVQFKLLMNLLSLRLTRWVAGVLLEKKQTMVMQLGVGNWSSAPHQLTKGLPQGSHLSPVLFNVYTKGLADLNQCGPSKILTLTETAEAVQQQLDGVSTEVVS